MQRHLELIRKIANLKIVKRVGVCFSFFENVPNVNRFVLCIYVCGMNEWMSILNWQTVFSLGDTASYNILTTIMTERLNYWFVTIPHSMCAIARKKSERKTKHKKKRNETKGNINRIGIVTMQCNAFACHKLCHAYRVCIINSWIKRQLVNWYGWCGEWCCKKSNVIATTTTIEKEMRFAN